MARSVTQLANVKSIRERPDLWFQVVLENSVKTLDPWI